jgi:hypothetical protein
MGFIKSDRLKDQPLHAGPVNATPTDLSNFIVGTLVIDPK